MIHFITRNACKICVIISIFLFYYFNGFNVLTKDSTYNSNNFNQVEFQNEQIKNEDLTNEKEDFLTNYEQNVDFSSIIEEENSIVTNENNSEEWRLVIPTIGLDAEIAEGTTKEVMNEYIGHFEDTSKINGNVGLAAHNRGYQVNYFQNLKQLVEGDEIFYYYEGIERKYIVKIHTIIKDTDWSYLENTNDNVITLITCVEDEPEYRRCIQAIEV